MFAANELPELTMDERLKQLPDKDDKVGFDLFFKKYYPRLTAYACLFVDPQAAEDLVQDLFVNLWEKSDKIEIHTSLEAYLFKAVHLRSLNHIKQRKTWDHHHKLIEDYIAEFEFKLFDPDKNESIQKLFMDDIKEEIKAAIDSLPVKCREVFMLSYIYDLKNKEISEIIGISLSTVENHIYNALKVLRQKLAQHSYLITILFPLH